MFELTATMQDAIRLNLQHWDWIELGPVDVERVENLAGRLASLLGFPIAVKIYYNPDQGSDAPKYQIHPIDISCLSKYRIPMDKYAEVFNRIRLRSAGTAFYTHAPEVASQTLYPLAAASLIAKNVLGDQLDEADEELVRTQAEISRISAGWYLSDDAGWEGDGVTLRFYAPPRRISYRVEDQTFTNLYHVVDRSPVMWHCENGPAVEFEGLELYYLNGVRVDRSLVMTPPEDLDPQLIFETINVDVRREIVRKIGAERLIDTLDSHILNRDAITIKNKAYDFDGNGKVVEVQGAPKEVFYTLHSIVLERGTGWDTRAQEVRVLEMDNQSLEGVKHFEFVDIACNTVDDAIRFRNQIDRRSSYEIAALT